MYTIQVYFVEYGPSLRKLLTAFYLMIIGHNFLNFKTLSDTLSENSELGYIRIFNRQSPFDLNVCFCPAFEITK